MGYLTTVKDPAQPPVPDRIRARGRIIEWSILEEDQSLVRKLLAQGLDVYMVDSGSDQKRAQRWLDMSELCGWISQRMRRTAIRQTFIGVADVNFLGICQGGVVHDIAVPRCTRKDQESAFSPSRHWTLTATGTIAERGAGFVNCLGASAFA